MMRAMMRATLRRSFCAAAFCTWAAWALLGCASDPCTPAASDPSKPSVSIECPTKTLCYQGECVPACNAGMERAEACEVDEDCRNSARPSCVAGYCSTCAKGEECIPGLNICAQSTSGRKDAGVRDGGRILAQPPLDGGTIDGSVFLRDAGFVDPPGETPPTHVFRVVLVQSVAAATGAVTSSIAITSRDVRGAGFVHAATVAVSGRCEIRTKERTTLGTGQAVSMGPITIESQSPSALNCPDAGTCSYKGTFKNGGYEYDRQPPNAMLQFSTVQDQTAVFTNVTIYSPGEKGIVNAWPAGQQRPSLHAPLEMKPAPPPDPTSGLLQGGVDRSGATMTPLELVWVSQSPRDLQGMAVRVRIEGPVFDLVCEPPEADGKAVMPACMLEIFRSQAPPESAACIAGPDGVEALRGKSAPLYFEREFGERLLVPPASLGLRIEMTVRVRHSIASRIRF